MEKYIMEQYLKKLEKQSELCSLLWELDCKLANIKYAIHNTKEEIRKVKISMSTQHESIQCYKAYYKKAKTNHD